MSNNVLKGPSCSSARRGHRPPPPPAEQHATADLGDDRLNLVGHQQQGGAGAGQITQDLQQLMAGAQVEAIGRFIEHQHLGIVHQGPGQQDAPLLTIGELGQRALGQIPEGQLGHQLPHALALGGCGLLAAADPHRAENPESTTSKARTRPT